MALKNGWEHEVTSNKAKNTTKEIFKNYVQEREGELTGRR